MSPEVDEQVPHWTHSADPVKIERWDARRRLTFSQRREARLRDDLRSSHRQQRAETVRRAALEKRLEGVQARLQQLEAEVAAYRRAVRRIPLFYRRKWGLTRKQVDGGL